MRRPAPSLLLLAVLVLGSACQKEAKPPPPPRKCARVERASDRVVDVVLCAESDADQDGVDDAVDLCPEHKEAVNNAADKDGCPDPDRDLDLFVDYEDTCPDEKGVAPDGCAGDDADGDLIANHLDSCPHEKEDVDGDKDSDGCPDGAQVETVAKTLDEQLWQKARIEVRRGRARATKAGDASLEELAALVATRPADIKRVRIVGYSSLREVRRGKAKDLAKDRVKLVEARLREAGVDARAFERAIYPLKDRKERVGRVDVMVFLDLEAAMRRGSEERPVDTRPADTKPADTKPADTKPTDTNPADTKPADAKPADAKPTENQPAVEPYTEPEKPAADDDWDLAVQ